MDENALLEMIKTVYAETILDFGRCIKLDPKFSNAYVDRSDLYAFGGELERSHADLLSAIEIDPTSVRAFVNFGVLQYRFSLFAGSIENYDKVFVIL